MSDMNQENNGLHGDKIMNVRELAALGHDEIAYIRPLTSGDVQKLFPDVEGVSEGMQLFGVYTADGKPLALTDSLNAAIANVRDHDLALASVH
jgi:hypothetical protein